MHSCKFVPAILLGYMSPWDTLARVAVACDRGKLLSTHETWHECNVYVK